MATGNQFNLYTTYYERFLALSVSIRVGNFHQLKLETPRFQPPVLRYRDITFTSEYIKESLSAVCPVLGVHNVARVRMLGSLLLIEVDFTKINALERFCKSLSSGEVQQRLQDRLKHKGNLHSPEQDIDVILKLHLVLPNAEKKSVASREVTTQNYEECFTLINESALFEFQSLNIAHDAVSEETAQPHLIGIDDLHELLKDLLEVMANWFTVGIFLKISYYILEAIQKDNRDKSEDCLREMLATWVRGGNASPAVLVQALIKAGYVVLGKKMAVKHGVMTTVSRIAETDDTQLPSTEDSVVTVSTGGQVKQLHSHTLAEIRQEIATKDTQCSSFSDQLDELKKEESKVMKSLEQTRSFFESTKVKINKLECEKLSLVAKKKKKQSSKEALIRQKSYTFGEDLIKLNQKINGIEESVHELSQKIAMLEKLIMIHGKQAELFEAELILRDEERKEWKMKIDKIQKAKEDLGCKLKEDRNKFEIEMQRMLNKLKLSETKVELLRDELSHKREVELAQANSGSIAINAPLLLDVNKHNGWVESEKVPSGKKRDMWNKADRISRTELQQNYPDASRFNETNGNVAAIDFGATFCSLAFALVGNSDMKSVEINTVKFNGYYTRVPTVILLRELKWTSPPSCDDLLVSRTCDYEVVSFGYDAVTQLHSLRASQRSHYLYFEEFKMRLQQYENVHRNMTITSLDGRKFYLVEVIAFVLKYLKCQLEHRLAKTQQPLKSDEFDWVITVPAIWKARGKRMMREAAYMAGLTSADPGITSFLEVGNGVPRPPETNPDKLTLALEPEAVAIHCQTLPSRHLAYQSLMNGPLQSDRYVVIDIREYTVDITVHCHDQQSGVRVITPPAGNACGGTMVNREFSMFLQEIVEDKPDFARFIGSGNRFERMAVLNQLLQKYFEDQKASFGDTASARGYGEELLTGDKLAIKLPHQFIQFYGFDKIEAGIAALDDDRVELEDDVIYITPSKFASFFAPAIQSILECIKDVFERIKEEVDTVYLVGGFGGFKYTYEKISSMMKAKFPRNKIQIVVPKDHKLAAVQGAVKYRLKPDVISSRVMDASYGTDFAPEYNPLLHDRHYAGLDLTGTPRVKGVYMKYVEKGEKISSDEVITGELYPLSNFTESMTICLYSSFDKEVKYVTTPDGNPNPSIRKIGELIIDMPNPEKLPREERRVELTMDFSHTEIQIRARYLLTGEEKKTVAEFLSTQEENEEN